ncbi:MAG: miniconductance mechanosensitive channel MscM [Plesiomonas sp.]|uniref:miniconductance mechanosensitive channel MscM n=1 Tax=Plesiomonas sp. TaxID=2486279 RepID=UPI003EE769A9
MSRQPLTRLPIFLLFCLFFSLIAIQPAQADILQSAEKLQQSVTAVEAGNLPDKKLIIDNLQTALTWLKTRDDAQKRRNDYQSTIDNYPEMTAELRQKLLALQQSKTPPLRAATSAELEQHLLQANSKLLSATRELQQESEQIQSIIDSLNDIPARQSEARNALAQAEQRLQSLPQNSAPANQSQEQALRAEVAARKAQVDTLELEQLSANNRLELARLAQEISRIERDRLDEQQQALRAEFNEMRQKEARQALDQSNQLIENSANLPQFLSELVSQNQQLSQDLNQQALFLERTAEAQRTAQANTNQVKMALSSIREQAQWLSVSNALGESLRSQIAKLPKMPKPQQLDREMADIRAKRIQFDEMLSTTLTDEQKEQIAALPKNQRQIWDSQYQIQHDLLTSLITGTDTSILELAKLKVATNQQIDALKEIKIATNRYLFWLPDLNPIGFSFPLAVLNDMHQIVSMDIAGQIAQGFAESVQSESVIWMIVALCLVIAARYSRNRYLCFLDMASSRVGKVTLDSFGLTLRTLIWSTWYALPVPILLAAVGNGLLNAWAYPAAIAFGESLLSLVPVISLFVLTANFARAKGLFITHFGWNSQQVSRAMRYYAVSLTSFVPLWCISDALNSLNDRQFNDTLVRLAFIGLCIVLMVLTASLKRAKVPLYLNAQGSGQNMINYLLWGVVLATPPLAILFTCLGYLSTSRALLARVEVSLVVWLFLLLIYYLTRRWMLIQRRRIAFDRAKHRRSEILAQRARNDDDSNSSNDTALDMIEEPVIDLDVISAKSLQLIRSIISLAALGSLVLIWSELHSAFAFLDNVNLWNVMDISNGVESIQPITLGSLLFAGLSLMITAKIIRNLPALMELALLQHLDLTPGTGYAITTLTKYSIIILGIMITASMIGVDWGKLQWLVAALGVGLGFGLQEIFANFISGLIILFEKPIRIGDTVTIRDLTGTITKINTRATTIVDWDRKEIIVPNKAFITEQFINWSLSDPITRIVLRIPAPSDADSELVSRLIEQAARHTTNALETPAPEVYLVDLQQGIPLYEIRLYAAEMGHRMPIRNELHKNVLALFRAHQLELPYPPSQIRVETMKAAQVFKTGGL